MGRRLHLAVKPTKRRRFPVTRTILADNIREDVLNAADGDMRRVQNLKLDGETVVEVLVLNKPKGKP